MDIAEKVLRQKQDFDDVYEAGRKAEYDAFWDEFQNYGNRKSYLGAFGSCFTAENFKPKYPIIPKRAYNYDAPADKMFYYTNRDDPKNPIDLSKYPIDLSHLYDKYDGTVGTVFENANVENVFVDLSNVTKVSKLFMYQNSDYGIKNICLRITESLTSISDMFYYVSRSEKGALSLSFTEDSVLVASLALPQTNYLTLQSIYNIFGIMSDTVTGKTLTLKTDLIINTFGNVDSEEWTTLVATKPNWTISLT